MRISPLTLTVTGKGTEKGGEPRLFFRTRQLFFFPFNFNRIGGKGGKKFHLPIKKEGEKKEDFLPLFSTPTREKGFPSSEE